jgi:hypothetical protein
MHVLPYLIEPHVLEIKRISECSFIQAQMPSQNVPLYPIKLSWPQLLNLILLFKISKLLKIKNRYEI